MQKIKVTLPATLTSLGSGLGSLGLAVGLYTTIEISNRSDESLVVETMGEGAGRYGIGLRHPVVLALIRIFQKQEKAVLGLNVRVNNNIPLDSGLGAEAAFWVAGVIAANNLLGTVYNRETLLEIAAQISGWPDQTATTILGGLTASLIGGNSLTYRPMPVAGLSVIVALPELGSYKADVARVKPERVPLNDAIYNLSRLPLLIEALRTGDYKLLSMAADDRLYLPYLKPHIPGFDHAAEMARRAGALAVTLSGGGPAIIAFAEEKHQEIAAAMRTAFANAGVQTRAWVLPVDRQGVVISVAGTA